MWNSSLETLFSVILLRVYSFTCFKSLFSDSKSFNFIFKNSSFYSLRHFSLSICFFKLRFSSIIFFKSAWNVYSFSKNSFLNIINFLSLSSSPFLDDFSLIVFWRSKIVFSCCVIKLYNSSYLISNSFAVFCSRYIFSLISSSKVIYFIFKSLIVSFKSLIWSS